MVTGTSPLRIRILPPSVGVEIGGVDLRQPPDDDTWARIRSPLVA